MSKLNSFRDIIENMFFDDIFNTILDFIENNPDKLESNSYHVEML